MIHGEHIIVVSAIDWDFNWQAQQAISKILANAGNRILFIDNTGVRAPRIADTSRLWKRLTDWRRGTLGFRKVADHIHVYSPLILPFPNSRLASWVNCIMMRWSLRRWMQASAFHLTVVWTYLPTKLANTLTEALSPLLYVYYCYGDFAAASGGSGTLRELEIETFRTADIVFAASQHLHERAERHNRDSFLFPTGVDFERFHTGGDEPVAIPEELDGLPSPVIGYIGGVHRWIDQALVAAIAGGVPEGSVVLVGPIQTDVSRLEALQNVHLLGARAPELLPQYLRAFDVGTIPYVVAPYTDHIQPAKLCEYLAAGLPVVSTGLHGIEQFNDSHPGTMAVADGGEDFVAAIRSVLAGDDLAAVRRRLDAARRHSWRRRVQEMCDLLEPRLYAKRRAEPETWQELLDRTTRALSRRLVRIGALTLVAYLLVFYSPLPWILAEPLRVEQPPAPSAAIVVFAGGVGESGQAGQGYQERVQRAIELYREGFADRLLFSSGFVYTFSEVELMRVLAMSQGVPESAIVLEDRAASTLENVVNTSAILRQQGWDSILLVSSPYHMRRASFVFDAVAPEIKVRYTPVRDPEFYRHRIGASWTQIRAIMHEYAAIAYYWMRGWI